MGKLSEEEQFDHQHGASGQITTLGTLAGTNRIGTTLRTGITNQRTQLWSHCLRSKMAMWAKCHQQCPSQTKENCVRPQNWKIGKSKGKNTGKKTKTSKFKGKPKAIWAETVPFVGKAPHILTTHIIFVSLVLLAYSLKFPRVLVSSRLP